MTYKLSEVKIIPATDAHGEQIWQIFQEVVAAGDTYVFDPKTTREQALSYWLSPEAHTLSHSMAAKFAEPTS